MATEFTTKVRLVRCPKCRLLLPELPDFQVYKCGGCGAILQAKNRLNGLRSRSTGLNGTVAAQMIGLGHVSEDKASSTTSCNGTLSDSGECSSDQIDEKNQSKFSRECSLERKSERDENESSEGTESSSSSLKGKAPASGELSLERRNERDGSNSSEGTESSSSSLKATTPDLGECSLGRNIERDESKSSEGIRYGSLSSKAKAPDSGEYSLEQNIERDESKSSEGLESSSSSPKATTPDLGECSLERNNERDESKFSEGIESSSSSPKATFPDSGECFSDHNNEKNQNKFSKDEESSSLSQKVILPESGEYTSIQNNERDPDNSSVEDYGGEQLGDLNLPDENQNNQSDQNDYGDLGIKQLGVSKETSSSMELTSNESKESLPITAACSAALKDDESLPLVPNVEVDIEVEIDSDSTSSSSSLNAVVTRGSSSIYPAHMLPRQSLSSDIILSSPDEQSHAKADINMSVDSDFRRASVVNPGATRESDDTVHMPAQESSSSGTLTSSPNEQLKEPHNSVPKSFDQFKSSNTFETTDFLSPRSEFSTAVRDRSKSPATRSHHAYDGSVSSYDDIDDQFYNHNVHTFQDAYKAPNLAQSEERYRRNKFLAESMVNRVSELPNQARSSWSSMSDKNGHAMKYRNRDQGELLPPRRPGHPSRDHARVQRDEYMASLQRGSLGGYGNGHFTNQMHNEFQSNSDYQSEMSVSAEPDKLSLLRMVYELQNQVNNLNVQASRQEHIPQYHNYEASEEELFHGLNHPRGFRRSRAGSHYTQQRSNYTRIPFSSEATTSRHQVDPSYMHHCPPARQYSVPMPLPIRCNTNGLRRVHPGYASSQWHSETMSDDLRHNSHEVKKYYGEKQQMAKRHFLPIAGGAPIVICYNCFKPLQIPADFLLFKRRCHRLQCGACSKVLKFSLHKRTHIVPYEVNAIGPPPSEVADPVSCSDDYGYGLSYCKSGSTEAGYAVNVTPSSSLQSNSVHERNMSYGSNNPTRGRQGIVLRRSQSQNKDKNPVERFMSARTSSNMLKSKNHSSEVEELPPKSSSPLHQLMGYKSPSQVIRGFGISRSGTKSSLRK
ncbi:serine-rich adhesin for platelets [Rosa sericea]